MRTQTTGLLVAIAIAMAMVAAACGSGESDEVVSQSSAAEATATATPSPTETSETPDSGDSETTATATPTPTETPETFGSANFDGSAPELTMDFEPVPAGPYVIQTLGIPLSLTVGEDWFVQENGDARTVLTDPDSFGPGDRDVFLIRPIALSEPSKLTAPVAEQEPWPVDDLEGWLGSVGDGIVTTEPREVSLGGRDAKVFDVSLAPDFPCGPDFCAGFVSARVAGMMFDRNYNYRVWWVDGGEYEPLAIVVGSGPEDSDFFAKSEALLSTIAFDTPGPHPVPDGDLWVCGYSSLVHEGTVEFPTAGGLRLTLPEERFVAQRGALALIDREDGSLIDFMIVEESPDGQPIETVDDAVAALEAAGMDVTETSVGMILGQPARVFDIAAQPGAANNLAVIPEWFNPVLGLLWFAETDRGVFLYGAETAETQEELDGAIAEAEAILPSLEFIDSPCPDAS
jgi:hypothetical protein